MPPIELTDRNMYGTLWTVSSIDDYGRVVLNSPVDFVPSQGTGCRFINTENVSLDPMGRVVQIDATLITDRDIPEQSIFFPGTQAEFVDGQSQLYEIITVDNTPDLKNRFIRYECKLRKYGKTLPDLA